METFVRLCDVSETNKKRKTKTYRRRFFSLSLYIIKRKKGNVLPQCFLVVRKR